ncbi:unnamed protein product, partial [Amoebophrya sp. A120]|eukprot:GSA120T00008091001.1
MKMSAFPAFICPCRRVVLAALVVPFAQVFSVRDSSSSRPPRCYVPSPVTTLPHPRSRVESSNADANYPEPPADEITWILDEDGDNYANANEVTDDLQSFDWRFVGTSGGTNKKNKNNFNLRNLIEDVKVSQLNPAPSATCWVIAAATSFADRFRIAIARSMMLSSAASLTKTAFPLLFSVNALSPQLLLNFDSSLTGGGSSQGGDPIDAFRFFKEFGTTDDSCAIWEGGVDLG